MFPTPENYLINQDNSMTSNALELVTAPRQWFKISAFLSKITDPIDLYTYV